MMRAPPKLIIEFFLTDDERTSPVWQSVRTPASGPMPRGPAKEKMRGRAGIYRIVHIESGKSYVGSSINILQRWDSHRSRLKNQDHSSARLQNAWNKYGAEAFIFECLELLHDLSELQDREQFWTDHLRSYERESGFNSRSVVRNNLGYITSAETRAKIAQALKGRKRPPEVCRAVGMGNRGKKLTAEQLVKQSLAHMGIKPSQEARERMRQGQLNRASFTDVHRKNISLSLIGRKRSDAARRAMSLGQMGRKHSAETRAKMAAAQQNRRLREAGTA